MNRAKGLLGLSILVMTAILPNGAAASAQPPATKPAATQPAYPLWDGNESVGAYARRAGIKDVEIALALDGNVTLKLTLIPAGKFIMGSPKDDPDRIPPEEPARQVTITKPYYMSALKVSQDQWHELMGTTIGDQSFQRGKQLPLHGVGPDYPMYYVSWHEANAFCATLSRATGKTVRLPTEAEWEHACRAGSKTRYAFGDSEKDLGKYAWYKDNSDGNSHVLGEKLPNAWGLFDMAGNVYEWCKDGFDSYEYAKNVDPQGQDLSLSRILRSGGWGSDAAGCRSAFRNKMPSSYRDFRIGFRVAMELPAARPVESPVTNPSVTPATMPGGSAASKPTTTQPAYPLWDGNESVADYAKRAGIKDVQVSLALDGNVTLKLTLIPAGKFLMGSPASEKGRRDNESQHEVTISKPFYMGVCEVTQEQYEQVMGKNPSVLKEGRNPVESLTWGDAVELRTRAVEVFRLPTPS